MKTNTKFDTPTQFDVTAAWLDLVKTLSGDKKDLSIQVVVETISTAYLSVNSHPVGKIIE